MCKLTMIDDNPMDHLIMQKVFDRYDLFKDASYSLDGRLIIDFIKENLLRPERIPDILLLDMDMPQFSGWQFLEQFARLYPAINKDVNIYTLLSSVDPADGSRAKMYPFVKGFYQKPIKKEEMILLYLSYHATGRVAG